MTLAYVDEVEKIKRIAPLTDADIARATGTSAGTVAAWRSRRQAPRGKRALRVAELSAVVEHAAGVIKPEAIPVWLNRPVPLLEHRTPAEAIAAGEHRRVAGLIDDLMYGAFS